MLGGKYKYGLIRPQIVTWNVAGVKGKEHKPTNERRERKILCLCEIKRMGSRSLLNCSCVFLNSVANAQAQEKV